MTEDSRPDARREPLRAEPAGGSTEERDGDGDPYHPGPDRQPGGEPPGATTPPPPREAAALNAAIGELEQILSEHGLDPLEPAAPLAETGDPAAPSSGEQYTIPLLHEVVVPNRTDSDTAPAALAEEPDRADEEAAGPPLLRAKMASEAAAQADRVTREAERYRPLFERLSSEIEVIVETGVEEALRAASKEIVQKVNDHLAIVLPEVLDELSHLDQTRPERDED